MKHIFSFKKTSGFTLVETLVAVSVFTVVITVGIGALLSTIAANRDIQSEREIVNGLSLAMESITRKIRVTPAISTVGTNFIVIADPDAPSSFLTYSLQANGKIGVANSGNVIDITPDGFTVQNFSVMEAAPVGRKKLITLRIVGVVNAKGVQKQVSMQTTVSPRSL